MVQTIISPYQSTLLPGSKWSTATYTATAYKLICLGSKGTSTNGTVYDNVKDAQVGRVFAEYSVTPDGIDSNPNPYDSSVSSAKSFRRCAAIGTSGNSGPILGICVNAHLYKHDTLEASLQMETPIDPATSVPTGMNATCPNIEICREGEIVVSTGTSTPGIGAPVYFNIYTGEFSNTAPASGNDNAVFPNAIWIHSWVHFVGGDNTKQLMLGVVRFRL